MRRSTLVAGMILSLVVGMVGVSSAEITEAPEGVYPACEAHEGSSSEFASCFGLSASIAGAPTVGGALHVRYTAREDVGLLKNAAITHLREYYDTDGGTPVERVLDLFEPQAHESNVEIMRYLDAELPSILLEPQTLQAALVNLVKNALEAMPDGGQLVARTRLTRFGVALDLIDTGCGMNESTAMHMFEAFYSTKNGGSGLGLPTARKIIEAHGGRIDVQSDRGRGTQFTLEFPTPKRIA